MMPQTTTHLEDWLRINRAEYHEFTGLDLTKSQVQRLWSLDSRTCDEVIRALEEERFLRRTPRGGYVRNDA